MTTPKVTDVFGIRPGTNPLSYVVRPVELAFRAALANPMYEALVIYGTSKQGKSSLRRHVLPDGRCTYVRPSLGIRREALYREILNQAGVAAGREEESEDTGERSWGFGFGSLLNAVGINAGGRRTHRQLKRHQEVAIDYSLGAAVARRYQEVAGTRPIVIDDFHCFSPDLQKELATDIRAFGERGIKTVILGTWRAHNHLQRLNSDLMSRVEALSIEPWTESDLLSVIEAGECLLNISLGSNLRSAFIQRSAGNIAVLQRALLEYLTKVGVTEASAARRETRDLAALTKVCDAVAQSLLEETIDRFRSIGRVGDPWVRGKTRMHWLLKAALSEQGIVNVDGVDPRRVLDRVNRILPGETQAVEQLTPQALGVLLKHSLLSEQQRRIGTPIIAYDDAIDRLIVIDGWTLFTLRRRRQEIADAL